VAKVLTMDTLPYLLIAIVTFGIPMLVFAELKGRRQAVAIFIHRHTGDSPIIYSNIAVWCKNLQFPPRDLWTMRNLRRCRSYDFYRCDIVLTKNGVIVRGKAAFLNIEIAIAPVLFTSEDGLANTYDNVVRINGGQKHHDDLEIDFNDPAYPGKMTLVVKNISGERRDRIMEALNILD